MSDNDKRPTSQIRSSDDFEKLSTAELLPTAIEESLARLESRLARLEQKLDTEINISVKNFWQLSDLVEPPADLIRCIVCGNSNLASTFGRRVSECQFGGGRLERFECSQCDAIFGPLKILNLLPHQIDREYRALYATYSEGDMTDSEVKTFYSLEPRQGGVYLDWGCGAWAQTIPRLRQDWDVWGFEPSATVDSDYIARHRWQITAQFDGIFSNNVIEHFLDPVAEFRYFSSILKPGGKMAHSSPCYEYRYDYTRFHTLFLLGRSPEVLAAATGFSIVDRIQEGEYINYVFQKNEEAGG